MRSCSVRTHRVTLLTAYAYLGIIYDTFPRHPVFPVPPALDTIASVRTHLGGGT